VSGKVLHVRWLGRVEYEEALDLQHALVAASDSYLLLLEHPHVYTLGVRTDPSHLLVDPASVGARALWTDRGGDITYHGPGQLVGYPIIDVPIAPDATPRYVHTLEAVLVDVLASFGIEGFALDGFPGVWVDRDDPRKIAAIGVKLSRGRSMHGFALNVSTDLGMFGHIVPCGIADKGVTSLAAEGVEVTLEEVARRVGEAFSRRFEFSSTLSQALETQRSVVTIGQGRSMERRLARAGFDFKAAVPFSSRKPAWIRPKVRLGEDYRSLEHLVRGLGLVTVCEEAGCPNIYECWADGTATFMINGASCTRACSFCLVDTAKPDPLDREEPARVAEAVAALGLSFAVVTAVARDDLPDGGARAFAETIEEIRRRNPGCSVEVLIPDFKGDREALGVVLDARPDVLNHNVETVARLQRAVRPSASYARSLTVLARARQAGAVTKSGLIVGLGERRDELEETMRDMRNVGVDILTVGQYLRPSAQHQPVARYYRPEEFAELRDFALGLGFRFVEASPLARSSYHARQGSDAAAAALQS